MSVCFAFENFQFIEIKIAKSTRESCRGVDLLCLRATAVRPYDFVRYSGNDPPDHAPLLSTFRSGSGEHGHSVPILPV